MLFVEIKSNLPMSESWLQFTRFLNFRYQICLPPMKKLKSWKEFRHMLKNKAETLREVKHLLQISTAYFSTMLREIFISFSACHLLEMVSEIDWGEFLPIHFPVYSNENSHREKTERFEPLKSTFHFINDIYVCMNKFQL